MSRLSLTSSQRRRLQRQLHHTHDARLYRRTLAILEVSRGQPVAQVAQSLGVTRRSIDYWSEHYREAFDPTALVDDDRPGRPSLWTEDLTALLRTLLVDHAPDQLGYSAVEWTAALLQEHLEHCTGQRLSETTIRRELHGLGYVWKRSRYALAPDPELEKKNTASAVKSGACVPEAFCWLRMRPICCCFRP
jgi:transposase